MATYHSLNGSRWQLTGGGLRRPVQATVPGCVHSDLLRAGEIEDPFVGRNEHAVQWIEERDWTYVLEFFGRPAGDAGHIDLVAEGLDTVARVVINGQEIGRTENMFITHRWPVKKHLRAGMNRLEIHFSSPMDYVRRRRPEHSPREINDPVGGCTRIRKQQCSFGWDWGPRLATSGIWRGIGLEAWDRNRLESVQVRQTHRKHAVVLDLEPELAVRDETLVYCATLRLRGRTIAEVTGGAGALQLVVEKPELWWPNGQGAQPLYSLEINARDAAGLPVGHWAKRIGLRTVVLDQTEDAGGRSFCFVVNGRAIFSKGANWIPAHALTAGLGRADYEPLLRDAAAVHMNMIRVWGGGVYEHEAFYDLCDELGLLVWQDFMFSCTLYPGDAAFLRSAGTEARQQVARLRHRACLALWCGNNEIESLNGDALGKSAKVRRAHDQLFEKILRRVVDDVDGVTPYWRSSPVGSQTTGVAKSAPKQWGDAHDWDVWHARHPVKAYEQSRARFASEFGMQSFSSPEIAATFCDPAEWNIFSPAMENHQKNPAGNAIILDYVSRLYRFPKDYAALAYLSQLNQAHCMKVAVEHWRRAQPHTMGALYWQLNDCWPVASWSSLEFGGKWKPLHYAARRFFAPMMISVRVEGDESAGIGNRLKSSVHMVELYTVYDDTVMRSGTLQWSLQTLAGRILRRGKKQVRLRHGESRRRARLDFSPEIAAHGREQLVLAVELKAAGLATSEDVVLFTAPRQLVLPRGKISSSISPRRPGHWEIELVSAVYQHRVMVDLPGVRFHLSDNAFDLLPGKSKRLALTLSNAVKISGAGLRRCLKIQSLRDTY